MKKRVQVLIDDDPIYDEQVDSGEIAYINRDGMITLMAGPGTALQFLRAAYGLHP